MLSVLLHQPIVAFEFDEFAYQSLEVSSNADSRSIAFRKEFCHNKSSKSRNKRS